MNNKLTGRQLSVLKLKCKGLPLKQIASELGIADKTAHHHWKLVMNKLNLTGVAQAVHYALKHGLIENEYERK